MKTKENRNYGLDLLRIFSMFCVIIFHILGHGGILGSTSSAIDFTVVWGLETLALPAVNCFVLLSGYVGYRKDSYYPRLRNILSIWLVVLFYSILIFGCYSVFSSQNLSVIELIKSLLPVTTQRYWFVSAYFAMFFFTPMINFFVHKAHRNILYITVIAIILLAFPTLNVDPFGFNSGFSALWLISLYLFGAMIRKEDLLTKITVSKSLVYLGIGFLITWGTKIALHFLGSPFSHLENMFTAYTSITVLLMAFGWLALFSHIRTTNIINKLVLFLTPSVFSVYLIHDNTIVKQLFITNKFPAILDHAAWISPLLIILSAIIIFVVCIGIDKIRLLIFTVLRIPKFIDHAERRIKNTWNMVLKIASK